MISAIRTSVLAAGAAALLSAQAAYAAPMMSRSAAIDPLVSLSVFGTAQSRSAVCAAGASAAAAGAATAAAQTAPPGCVLPVAEPVAAPPVSQAVPPPIAPAPRGGLGIGTLPLLIGLAALLGLGAWLILDDDDDDDLIPISPV